MRTRLILTILGITLFCQTAHSEVTLEQCRDLAKSNYPLARQYDILEATRECNLKNASTMWMPHITVGFGGGWINSPFYASEMSSQLRTFADIFIPEGLAESPWQYQAGASIVQNIWDGGAAGLRKKVADAEAAREAADTDVSMHEMEKQVDEIFFTILLLEERKAQANGKIDVLEASLEKIRHYNVEGLVSDKDFKTMQAEVLSVRQQSESLASSIAASRLALSLITGRDMSAEELQIPAEPELAQMDVSPEFEYISQSRRLLDLSMKKLDVELMPKVGLFANLSYGYPSRNLYRNMTGYDPLFNAQFGIQVKFNLDPLYTRNSDKAVIRMQQNSLDIQTDMLKLRKDVNYQSYLCEITRLQNTLDSDREILQLRREIRQAAQDRMDDGYADTAELIREINAESEAALQESIHRIELLKYQYSLEQNGKTE